MNFSLVVLSEFRDLAQGNVSLEDFRSQKIQFNRHSLLETFDDFAKHKLLWKVVDRTPKGSAIHLVDVLFEVVSPDIADGVVLPVGYRQSMSIFENATLSCGRDSDCIRVAFTSLLDYVELYFGPEYRSAQKIKQYQKTKALVEGHDAVANLRVGEVAGYPQTLPEITPKPNHEESEN